MESFRTQKNLFPSTKKINNNRVIRMRNIFVVMNRKGKNLSIASSINHPKSEREDDTSKHRKMVLIFINCPLTRPYVQSTLLSYCTHKWFSLFYEVITIYPVERKIDKQIGMNCTTPFGSAMAFLRSRIYWGNSEKSLIGSESDLKANVNDAWCSLVSFPKMTISW